MINITPNTSISDETKDTSCVTLLGKQLLDWELQNNCELRIMRKQKLFFCPARLNPRLQ